jgi:anthranilate/para-aminobenzoate synthase component I
VVERSAGPDALLAQVADRPGAVLTGFLGTVLVATEPVESVVGRDVWEALAVPADGPAGGLDGAWIGYLGYGPPPGEPAAGTAPARLGRYGAVAQFLQDGTCLVWGSGAPARDLARRVSRYAVASAVRTPAGPIEAPASSLPAPDYRARVAEIVDRIAAGDFSQVNLVQCLDAAWGGSPLAFADRLWAAAGPAPMRAFARCPDGVLVSASPERLLAICDGIAVSAPIKGTAPAGGGAQLAASGKDRAEHVMIVDLVRNDLGRVSVAGGVAVPQLLVPLRTGYAEHLVSEVVGRLRPGVRVGDALAALFPAGSITGAPKHAAMSAIAELEPVGRGPAFGSMVVVAPDGRCDTSVLIRTAWLGRGRARYWCGGGVTWDSDPGAEYAEAMVKAQPFLEALGCG